MLFTIVIISLLALLPLSFAQVASTNSLSLTGTVSESKPTTSPTSFIDTLPTPSSSFTSSTSALGNITQASRNLTKGFQVIPPPLANATGVASNRSNILAAVGTATGVAGATRSFKLNPPIQTGDCIPSAGYPTKITVVAVLGFLGAFAFA